MTAIARHTELHAGQRGALVRHTRRRRRRRPTGCLRAAPREGVRHRPQLPRTRRGVGNGAAAGTTHVHQVPAAASSAPPTTSCSPVPPSTGRSSWSSSSAPAAAHIAAMRRLVARRRAHPRPGHLGPHGAADRHAAAVLDGQELRHVRPHRPGARVASTRSPTPTTSGLWCDVAGERMQDARTDDLIFTVPEIVEYLSAHLHARRRATSSSPAHPSGVGRPRGRFLAAGEVVDSGAEVIGELHNRCVAPVSLHRLLSIARRCARPDELAGFYGEIGLTTDDRRRVAEPRRRHAGASRGGPVPAAARESRWASTDERDLDEIIGPTSRGLGVSAEGNDAGTLHVVGPARARCVSACRVAPPMRRRWPRPDGHRQPPRRHRAPQLRARTPCSRGRDRPAGWATSSSVLPTSGRRALPRRRPRVQGAATGRRHHLVPALLHRPPQHRRWCTARCRSCSTTRGSATTSTTSVTRPPRCCAPMPTARCGASAVTSPAPTSTGTSATRPVRSSSCTATST